MAKFVVELIYGVDHDRRLEVRPAHREYTKKLADEGVVLAGGPFTDERGAILIYEAADEDALREILAADPYAEPGVLADTVIREWNAVSGSWVSGS